MTNQRSEFLGRAYNTRTELRGQHRITEIRSRRKLGVWCNMKACLMQVLSMTLFGCATTPTGLTDDERLARKYAGYSTELLQMRRHDIADYMAKHKTGYKPFASVQTAETEDPQREIDEIEQELLRRFHAGDERANLYPVP